MTTNTPSYLLSSQQNTPPVFFFSNCFLTGSASSIATITYVFCSYGSRLPFSSDCRLIYIFPFLAEFESGVIVVTDIYSKTHPDHFFCNFRASKSDDRRFWTAWNSSIGGLELQKLWNVRQGFSISFSIDWTRPTLSQFCSLVIGRLYVVQKRFFSENCERFGRGGEVNQWTKCTLTDLQVIRDGGRMRRAFNKAGNQLSSTVAQAAEKYGFKPQSVPAGD